MLARSSPEAPRKPRDEIAGNFLRYLYNSRGPEVQRISNVQKAPETNGRPWKTAILDNGIVEVTGSIPVGSTN
jgi:hypothetical protein